MTGRNRISSDAPEWICLAQWRGRPSEGRHLYEMRLMWLPSGDAYQVRLIYQSGGAALITAAWNEDRAWGWYDMFKSQVLCN